MAIARDKFWIFGVRAHQDDIWLGKEKENRWYQRSRITPAEAALMLDCPNMLMINCDGEPVPFSTDAYGYMESFCRMQNVVWSIAGSGGFRAGNEEQFICELAKRYPNVTGAFADDFMSMPDATVEETEKKREEIRKVRAVLDTAVRPLSMWLTMYTHGLATCDPSMWETFDTLSLWTWSYKDLDNLKENFALWEKKFPRQKKYLGIDPSASRNRV